MIRRLRVKGYKSLRDCAIELAPISVVFGPNGVGKSNLLDLIGLLSRLVSRETVREAFEGHRGRPLEAFYSPRGFGRDAYKELLEKEKLSFEVECDLELHPRVVDDVNRTLARRESAVGTSATYTKVTETRLRYSVAIGIHPKSGELFVFDERLQPLKKDLQPKAASVRQPFIESEPLPNGGSRFVARVERQGHPRYFDPSRARTLLSELSDPVYHPHVVAAAREISSWRVYYVEPARMRGDVGVQSADEPGRSGELLAPYYYSLQQRNPGTLRGIVRNLQELVPNLEDIRVDVREGLLEIVAINKGGAEFPARLLSEGTLRLLCILGIAVSPAPPAMVGYEEPENGVNAARLELIARILRNAVEIRPEGLQFLLTTHSPYLCNLLPSSLILSTWTPESETQFKTFEGKPDSLFFTNEIVEALDSTTSETIIRARA